MDASIEILRRTIPPLRWEPLVRDHTQSFVKRKLAEPNAPNRDELERVVLEAQIVLGRCVPPTDAVGQDTGLVVGYVQSGKTSSFTALISLARDNGYGLVIVLATTKNIIKEQSEARLSRDLGIETGDRTWQIFPNPDADPGKVRDIQVRIDAWKKEKEAKRSRKAVLITVLKQRGRLDNLIKVVGQLRLANVPALVIDDESDQASLNTKARQNLVTQSKEQSAIYERIGRLKAVLAHHTFLQYTATPQANLLLNLADVLSPSFAEPLTPGAGYVGGKEFFIQHKHLVEQIPPGDVPSKENRLTAAPRSLLIALRYFLLGAAIHAMSHAKGDENRSMMVHPSQTTPPHKHYKLWIERATSGLRRMFESAKHADEFAAIRKLFSAEYGSLALTCPGIPDLDMILNEIKEVLYDLRIAEVNYTAQAEKTIKWKETNYWILVGGNKLDRGFTVEGLSVTYMPRPLGKSPAADTLQQRARFFGYKRHYLGLCRVFVQADVKTAFTQYVEHEEFVRDALKGFRGRPLKDWMRDFVLTWILNPTRPNVIGLGTRRIRADSWIKPGYLHTNQNAIAVNRQIFHSVVADWRAKFPPVNATIHKEFKDLRKDSSSNMLLEGVPLGIVLADFLTKIDVKNYADAEDHTALLVALATILKQDPLLIADVFLIGNLNSQIRSREKSGAINEIFSGKSPNVNDFEKLIYVGDEKLHSANRSALHLRYFDLRPDTKGPVDIQNVPWFSFFVPKVLAKGLVIQKRGS